MAAAAEQDVVVENPAVTAIFSTRGAVLKSWRLKNYRDGLGAPLELIPQNVPNAPKPFTLEVDDAATSATLKNALFKPSAETLTIGSAPATLRIRVQGCRRARRAQGVHVHAGASLCRALLRHRQPERHGAESGGALGTRARHWRRRRRDELRSRAAADLLSRSQGESRGNRRHRDASAGGRAPSASPASTITIF